MYDRVHHSPFVAIRLDGKIAGHPGHFHRPAVLALRDLKIDSSSSPLKADPADAVAAARASRCEAMLAHPTAAVAIVEAGRIRAVNASWRRLFAMAPDAAVDATTAALFASAQVAARCDRMLRDRLGEARDHAGGTAPTAHATFEHPLVRVDGSGFLGEVLVWPLVGHGPTDIDAIWQVRDVTADRALHAELRDVEGYHRALSQHQRDLTFVIDRKGRIAYVSPSVDDVLGYPPASLLGRNFTTLLEPGQRSDTERWFRERAIRREGKDHREPASEDYRLRVVAHDGGRRILACHPHDCFDVPRLSGMVLHARDVTVELDLASQRALADATHERLRDRLATLAGTAPQRGADRTKALLAAASIDLAAAIVTWSMSSDDAGTRVVACHRAGRGFENAAGSTALTGDAVAFVDAIDRTDGVARGVDDVATDAATRDRRATFEASRIGAFIDAPIRVDERTCAWVTIGVEKARAWTRAEVDFVSALGPLLVLAGVAGDDRPVPTDPLTSLIGRVEAEKRLAALVAGRTSHAALLVLVVNLDRTRDINDRHGHAVGDRVIAEAARRLTGNVRHADFVARIGGDEFLVVLEETDLATTDALVQAILDDLAAPPADGGGPRVEASIGAARQAIDSADADSLWRKAELAMREAKERGRGQAVFFHPRIAAAIAARTALGAEIEEALERDQFVPFYQPQIALDSGKLVGLEALLRWQHPVRGLVLPEVFIDTVIARGLIDAVTKAVFGHVCDQIVRWRRLDGFPEVPVSVNVSAQQFHDRRLPALVASALLRTGLPARLLMLELTEQHLVVDSAATERVVKELTLLGVRIAIGSFGLNNASLRSLDRLRVSQIKLDRGLVERLPDDREGAIVVDAAIEIGRRLKCQVIAEGVETRAQWECLRDMGCEAGQGFYFGAPLSAAELQSFVAGHGAHPAP